jgi:hypothetical protein
MRARPHTRARPPRRALAGLLGCSCGVPEPEPAPAPPDRSGAAAHGPARRDDRHKSPTLRGLEVGAAQDHTALEQLTLVLDGYTNAKRDVARTSDEFHQRRALFFCGALNVDFWQCALFDGSDPGAHLVGVEYVISDSLYKTLPQSERQYWHSHVGEIDSGIVVAPGIDDAAHRALMNELRSTYGKGWRTWDTEHDALPLGEPTLMWSIAPGRLDPQVRTEMRGRRKR